MQREILILIIGILVLGLLVFVVSKNLKRTVQVMSGWGLYEVYNFVFDFLIWPIIQAVFGFMGVLLLILVALVNNFILLLWYQQKKVDWFGVNVFEDFKMKGHLWVHEAGSHKNGLKKISLYLPAKILQLMIWLLNKNDVFAFVTLSVWQDSFITTIFLRHGKFDRLDKRDYIVFVSSTVLSCLVWSVLMQVVITVIHVLGRLF